MATLVTVLIGAYLTIAGVLEVTLDSSTSIISLPIIDLDFIFDVSQNARINIITTFPEVSGITLHPQSALVEVDGTLVYIACYSIISSASAL